MGIKFAWFQLVFGSVYLVWGLKGKQLGARFFAPFGLLFILAGAVRLLEGHLSDAALITLFVVSFSVVGIWTVRTHRAFKAELQKLKKTSD